jgi:hypothetical protein
MLLAFAVAMRIATVMLGAIARKLDPKAVEALRCQRILREQFGLKTVAEYSATANATVLMCPGNDSLQSVIVPRIGEIRAALQRPDAMPNKHRESGCETLELPWGGGTPKHTKESFEGQGKARSSAMPQPA